MLKNRWRSTAIALFFLTFGSALAQPSETDAIAQKELVEFLAGVPFSQQELTTMVAEMIEDQQRDPAGYQASVKDTAEIRQTAQQIQDPLKLGLLRQVLLGRYYALYLGGHRSPTLELVLNKIQPVAWDAQRQMLLTAADLNGLLEYLSFQSQRQGGAALGPAERAALYQQFVNGFAQLSDEQMGFVCSGSLIWQLVAANWQRMSQQQQQGWSQNYPQSGGYAPAMGGGEQMDPYTYQRMSQMMLDSHVTNMNIIENMGGSGDYWEVRDDSW